jgi:hypothetical protein
MRPLLLLNVLVMVLLSSCVSTQSNISPARARLIQKLDSIRIKSLNFEQATLQEVISSIVEQSTLADPERRGVAITIRYPFANALDRRITVHGENLSLRDAIKMIGAQTGLWYLVEENSISLEGCSHEYIPTTRAFKISKAKLASFGFTATGIKKAFEDMGIDFMHPTSRISYNASTELLTVSNNCDVMGQIEEILKQLEENESSSNTNP